MARGWESKSVESQMADERRPSAPRTTLTAEQRQARQRRRGLELARARVVEEMDATAVPVRRAALQSALAALDAELAKLGADAG